MGALAVVTRSFTDRNAPRTGLGDVDDLLVDLIVEPRDVVVVIGYRPSTRRRLLPTVLPSRHNRPVSAGIARTIPNTIRHG